MLYESIDKFNKRNTDHQISILGAVINGEDGYVPEGYDAVSDIVRTCTRMGIPLFDRRIVYSRSYPKGSRMAAPISATPYARYWTKVNFTNFMKEFRIKAGV